MEIRAPSPTEAAAAALVGAVFVGLSPTWWGQATGFEVYSLHAVFITLVVLAFLRYSSDLRAQATSLGASRLFFSVSVGLSFTNHLSTIMLAPPLILLFVRATGFNKTGLSELRRLAPGFGLGLLPYLYLPIRASMHPRLNWGSPDSWERFLEHVSGEQFHFAVMLSGRVFVQQSEFFIRTILSDTSVVGLVVAVLGLAFLWARARVHAIWTTLLFLTCATISTLYDINDIGNYYLPAFLALGVWIGSGVSFLSAHFGRRVGFALGLLLLALNAGRHFRPMNERGNMLAEELARNVLRELPLNSVVISNHWDYWVSASLYIQEVEGFRRDVVVLDPEGLRDEEYLLSVKRREPALMRPVAEELATFIRRATEFPFDSMTVSQAEAYYESYYTMITRLLETNPTRSFFVTEWTDPRIAAGFSRIPMGLVYLVTKDTRYRDRAFPEYGFHRWENRVDPYAIKVAEIYTTSLLARARYEEAHGRHELARRYGLYAMTFEPRFLEPDVPDFPLHIDDQIREVLRRYAELRERARASR